MDEETGKQMKKWKMLDLFLWLSKRVRVTIKFPENTKQLIRELIFLFFFGIFCFCLGVSATFLFVINSEAARLSEKSQAMIYQTRMLINRESQFVQHRREIDQMFKEFEARFRRIEHTIRIPIFEVVEIEEEQ